MKPETSVPPKNHGGWVGAVLLTCIFLGGPTGGAILINLGSQMQRESPEESQNHLTPTTPRKRSSPTPPSRAACPVCHRLPGDEAELIISDTPEPVANIPQEGGLSLQEIYKKRPASVVSITSQQVDGTSYGTGIIMSQSGYIITNCHVIGSAYSLSVTLYDGRVYDTQLVGKDRISDLAVLRVDASDLTAAEFGDSTQTQVGDAVVAIGSPWGQSSTAP